MTKPRITPWNGFYRCDGDGVAGFGMTPESAWHQWLAMLNPPKPAKPWVEDERFYPKPRSNTPQDDAMLLALAAWEPAQAH